jgi:hypothetical protein
MDMYAQECVADAGTTQTCCEVQSQMHSWCAQYTPSTNTQMIKQQTVYVCCCMKHHSFHTVTIVGECWGCECSCVKTQV